VTNGNGARHANGAGNGHVAKYGSKANGHGGANGHGAGNGHGNGGNGSHAANGAVKAGGATNGNGAHAAPGAQPVAAADGVKAVSGEWQAVPRPVGAAGAALGSVIGHARPGVVVDGMRLDRVELDRRGATVRCRVVLGRGELTWSAVAEASDTATGEAELAARVALDALRASGRSAAVLDGVSFVSIAGTSYVAAAVRTAAAPVPGAGMVAAANSLAWSAAAAAICAAAACSAAGAHEPRAAYAEPR
jgi:hypothetical protein